MKKINETVKKLLENPAKLKAEKKYKEKFIYLCSLFKLSYI